MYIRRVMQNERLTINWDIMDMDKDNFLSVVSVHRSSSYIHASHTYLHFKLLQFLIFNEHLIRKNCTLICHPLDLRLLIAYRRQSY